MSSPLEKVELQATSVACTRPLGNPAVPNSTFIPSRSHSKVPTDLSIPTMPSGQPLLNCNRSTSRPETASCSSQYCT
jgi:hypothetical protein